MNILVSGVAGDIGFGVGRILRGLDWVNKIYGIDIQSDHAGNFVFDTCSVSIRADDPNYLDWLSKHIESNHIDVFIPTSEAEISKISLEKIEYISSALVVITNSFVVNKSLDKYECLTYLSSCGIDVPAHGLVGGSSPAFYPVIVKPRSGQGSKGIVKVNDASQLPLTAEKKLVWQEYLSSDEDEYTCPVFASAATGIRVLILKRKLQGGFTHSGEVIENDEIFEYVKSIAVALELDGVMNVQLRLTSSGPKLFEINPRISSTLVFRDKMGFNDLKWLLELRLKKIVSQYSPPVLGTRFYRGVQEYIAFV